MRLLKYKKNIVAKAPKILPSVKISNKNYTIRKITVEDITNDKWLERWRNQFKRMLKAGHIGMIIIEKSTNNCVGYGWMSFNQPKPGHFNIFTKDYVWFHNDRINPDYRRKGLAKYLYKEKLSFVRKENKNIEIYSDTGYGNIAVRRIYEYFKFEELGAYKYISIGTPRIPYFYWNIGKVRNAKK